MEKEIVSEEKDKPVSDKPVLDEQTLAKLLEAAYVLQEHNRELQEMELGLDLKRDQLESEERSTRASRDATPQTEADPPASADYTSTLAEIVATQHQIQVRHLELDQAMSLVAERLTQIARASGAAIGILDYKKLDDKKLDDEREAKKDKKKDDKRDVKKDGKKLRYRVTAGLLTLPAGTEVPMEKALCLACLRTGQVLRCADVNPEFLLDTEECRRRGIQSLIAVPIFHDGGVAGGLELYYPTTHAFTEQDVHTCQLMAGLVTEALARDEEVSLKKSLASERAVMLEALEKLKPNLAALVDKPGAVESAARSRAPAIAGSAVAASAVPASAVPASTSASIFVCRKCGHKLVGEEQFCGNCGLPRAIVYEAPSMQSREASLRSLQETMRQEALKAAPAEGVPHEPEHERKREPKRERKNDQLALDIPELGMPELDVSAKEKEKEKSARPPSRTHSDAMPSERSLADTLQEEMPELFAPAVPLPDSPPDLIRLGEARASAEFEDSILADLEINLEAGSAGAKEDVVADETLANKIAADKNVVNKHALKKAGPGKSVPEKNTEPESQALAKPEHTGAWSSAANARDFLEQLASGKRPGALAQFWNTRRGDIYLVIAVILVAVVIRWGIWSSHSVGATGNATAAAAHRKPAPDADLSWFDRTLISLGLAEPPETPEYKGNPETQVWVDLHTALYYCPGADLYGKTPKGKFASQRDAQLDQFEPAYRKACD
ncbi:MAG: GAF domain-containing protein [Candidatus Sulfotelmatobacter sp.]